MSKRDQRGNAGEKDRQRSAIAREVEDFIAKGGRIEVLSDSGRQMARRIGGVWHSDEVPVPDMGGDGLD